MSRNISKFFSELPKAVNLVEKAGNDVRLDSGPAEGSYPVKKQFMRLVTFMEHLEALYGLTSQYGAAEKPPRFINQTLSDLSRIAPIVEKITNFLLNESQDTFNKAEEYSSKLQFPAIGTAEDLLNADLQLHAYFMAQDASEILSNWCDILFVLRVNERSEAPLPGSLLRVCAPLKLYPKVLAAVAKTAGPAMPVFRESPPQGRSTQRPLGGMLGNFTAGYKFYMDFFSLLMHYPSQFERERLLLRRTCLTNAALCDAANTIGEIFLNFTEAGAFSGPNSSSLLNRSKDLFRSLIQLFNLFGKDATERNKSFMDGQKDYVASMVKADWKVPLTLLDLLSRCPIGSWLEPEIHYNYLVQCIFKMIFELEKLEVTFDTIQNIFNACLKLHKMLQASESKGLSRPQQELAYGRRCILLYSLGLVMNCTALYARNEAMASDGLPLMIPTVIPEPAAEIFTSAVEMLSENWKRSDSTSALLPDDVILHDINCTFNVHWSMFQADAALDVEKSVDGFSLKGATNLLPQLSTACQSICIAMQTCRIESCLPFVALVCCRLLAKLMPIAVQAGTASPLALLQRSADLIRCISTYLIEKSKERRGAVLIFVCSKAIRELCQAALSLDGLVSTKARATAQGLALVLLHASYKVSETPFEWIAQGDSPLDVAAGILGQALFTVAEFLNFEAAIFAGNAASLELLEKIKDRIWDKDADASSVEFMVHSYPALREHLSAEKDTRLAAELTRARAVAELPCSYLGCKTVEGKGKKSKKCAECRMVKYCSIECQKNDWRQHKTVCKLLSVGAAAAEK